MPKPSWYEFRAAAESAKQTELFLYNEIGGFGISAAAFVNDLQAVPKDHRLVLRIHSPGGSVLDGNAIFTALKAHPGGVTTQIDGLAASMASVVALAGAPVSMAGNALMMIHNVSGGTHGDAGEMRKTADLLDKVQETIEATYIGKTGLSRKKIKAMMDAETWMTATEAKDLGFIDEITGDLKLAASFDCSRFKNFEDAQAKLTARTSAMSKENLPTEEESQSILQRLASFFKNAEVGEVSAQLALATEKISTLEAIVAKAKTANGELATAIEAKDAEIFTLTAKVTEAAASVEARIAQGIIDGCAAAGVEPIKRDEKANESETREGKGKSLPRAEFNRLSPADQLAFVNNNGVVTD